MSRRAAKILLQDMQIALERVLDYTKDINFEVFEEDAMCVDTVVRNLEIIGEAHCIAGMRNRIVHDYFGIDNGITCF